MSSINESGSSPAASALRTRPRVVAAAAAAVAVSVSVAVAVGIVVVVGVGVGLCGCASKGLPAEPGALRVSFVGRPSLGSEERPLAFSATAPQTFIVDIEALRNDRPTEVDVDFNGYAVITVQPRGETVQQPLSAKLEQGRASNVKVEIREAFGAVRLVATDKGYVPAASAGQALCNNGVDDDHDGYIDTKDRGCYYGNDDTEAGGSGASGASDVMFFANPGIADVQKPGPNNKDASQLTGTRVSIDRGFMLITRVGTDGLYVTDYDSARWDTGKRGWLVDVPAMSYRSAFAYNYSAPLNVSEGDCLVQLDGTVQEFYGYTELNNPTWKKGDYPFCAALARKAGLLDCPPDEAADLAQGSGCRRAMESLANTPFELTRTTVDEIDGPHSVWDQRWPGTETERFEAALVQLSDVDMFTELRKCDRNGNGIIDFADTDEANCSNACGEEPACQVWETYTRYSQWTVSFTDGRGQVVEVNVVSLGSIPKFNPRDPSRVVSDDKDRTILAPKKLGKIVGTLRHLSFGRPPWVIEPRRAADCPDCKY